MVKYKRLSDPRIDVIVLKRTMINEMALADGFKNAEAAKTVHPGIIDIYTRYADAAIRSVEAQQQFPVQTAADEISKTTPNDNTTSEVIHE